MKSEVELPRLRQNIFLIEDIDTQIVGNKLPSNLQVLKVLFYNIRVIKLSVRDAAALVVKEVLIFWEKARLPTKQLHRCIDKVESLYEQWKVLQKNAGKPFNIEKELNFVADFHNLLDIAHGNILDKIDDAGKQFLTNQRLPGRLSYINNIESHYDAQAAAQLEIEERHLKRLKKSEEEKNLISKYYYNVIIESLEHIFAYIE